MKTDEYLHAASSLDLSCICVTNHGDVHDCLQMRDQAGDATTIICGVEISSPDADFIFFSEDMEFLAGLEPLQEMPDRDHMPDDAAVVWAHPFAGIPGGLAAEDDHVKSIASKVDAIEVFNGNWPDGIASDRSLEIAYLYDLAQVGGSDSHRADQLMRCWTELVMPNSICSSQGLVDAIFSRRTLAAAHSQSGRSPAY